MNIIIIEAHEVMDGRALLRDGRADHIRNVLQAAVGDRLKVGVANGTCGTGNVLRCDQTGVELALTLTDESPQPWCDLILAMPRPRVLKRLWAQVTALGVGRIILVQAARVETCYFGSHWLRNEAYRPLLLEGLMQAGTTRVPIVQLEPNLKRFFADRLAAVMADAACFIAHPDDTPLLPSATLVHDRQRTVLAVGPEGGWLDDERALFESRGFSRLSLGARILRTDTACIALLAVLGQGFDPAMRCKAAVGGGCPAQPVL